MVRLSTRRESKLPEPLVSIEMKHVKGRTGPPWTLHRADPDQLVMSPSCLAPSIADRQLVAQSLLNDPVAAVVQDPAALFVWEAVLDHHVAALYNEQA